MISRKGELNGGRGHKPLEREGVLRSPYDPEARTGKSGKPSGWATCAVSVHMESCLMQERLRALQPLGRGLTWRGKPKRTTAC